MPGQTLLQHTSTAALLKGLILLRGNRAHHLAAMLCSACAQGFRPQDFSAVQAEGQGAAVPYPSSHPAEPAEMGSHAGTERS